MGILGAPAYAKRDGALCARLCRRRALFRRGRAVAADAQRRATPYRFDAEPALRGGLTVRRPERGFDPRDVPTTARPMNGWRRESGIGPITADPAHPFYNTPSPPTSACRRP